VAPASRSPPGSSPAMPAARPEPDALRSALEAAGWRCTRQRAAIYDHLARMADRHGHPTAEEVYQAVRTDVPSISLATVYKGLEALVASGLVTKLPTGDGSARYDARCDDHYHLRCLRSGEVQDLPTRFDPDLVAKLDPDLGRDLDARGFRVTGYRLELVGFFDDGTIGPSS
jgi:Fur family transcriptional regulator, peroxide stress response regulator